MLGPSPMVPTSTLAPSRWERSTRRSRCASSEVRSSHPPSATGRVENSSMILSAMAARSSCLLETCQWSAPTLTPNFSASRLVVRPSSPTSSKSPKATSTTSSRLSGAVLRTLPASFSVLCPAILKCYLTLEQCSSILNVVQLNSVQGMSFEGGSAWERRMPRLLCRVQVASRKRPRGRHWDGGEDGGGYGAGSCRLWYS